MNKDKIFPLISVITVVYNGELFIEETIKSVINQTYENIEYIIIDGGSSDGTLEIIKKYENHISYWSTENDNGIYDAMNKGIKQSKGDYLNFLNAGDSFCNLNIIENIFKRDDIILNDLIYGPILLHDEVGKLITKVIPKKFTKLNLIFWGTGTLCHQSIFIRKNIARLYSDSYKLKGELDWYFQFYSKVQKYCIVTEPIVHYYLGGTGDKQFKLNTIETIKVMFSNNNILGILSLPFLIYKYILKVFK